MDVQKTMSSIYIFHGVGGNPEENWFPWLKTELEKLGFTVTIPQFPANENHNLQNWFKVIEQYTFDEDTILIGHSVGATFILSLLEKLEHPVKATILASGFTSKLNLPEFDVLNKTFLEKEFDWEKIRHNGGVFAIFHGDNDPYVPLEKAEFITEKLNAPLVVIPHGGHLNTAAGFIQFPQLLDVIQNL